MLTNTASQASTMLFRRFYHKIGILGVPFNKGQPKKGVEMGPTVLRESGLIKDLSALHSEMDIKDYGDVNYTLKTENVDVDNMKNFAHIAACNEQLSNKVCDIIRDKRICLTVGGDHCIGLGTVDGHARAFGPEKLAVLWIDAHADLNTNSGSESGNVHGMPMALLVKELVNDWPWLPMMEWQNPVLSLKNVAYIGLRSVDRYEQQIIEKYGVAAYEMHDIERHGIRNIIKEALNKIDPESNRSLHVSFDIDSLDVLEAPSTGTPVRGGLTLREGIQIMEAVSNTGRLHAIDLVEVNPRIGNERDVQYTIEAAKQIIFAAFRHTKQ